MKFIARKFSDCCHPFQLRERFHGAFLRRQFHGLAILGLVLPPDGRQLAGLEIGMLFQNPQRIPTRNRGVLPGIAGQNDSRIARVIKQPFHVVHPHRPSFIQDNQLPFGRNRL